MQVLPPTAFQNGSILSPGNGKPLMPDPQNPSNPINTPPAVLDYHNPDEEDTDLEQTTGAANLFGSTDRQRLHQIISDALKKIDKLNISDEEKKKRKRALIENDPYANGLLSKIFGGGAGAQITSNVIDTLIGDIGAGSGAMADLFKHITGGAATLTGADKLLSKKGKERLTGNQSAGQQFSAATKAGGIGLSKAAKLAMETSGGGFIAANADKVLPDFIKKPIGEAYGAVKGAALAPADWAIDKIGDKLGAKDKTKSNLKRTVSDLVDAAAQIYGGRKMGENTAASFGKKFGTGADDVAIPSTGGFKMPKKVDAIAEKVLEITKKIKVPGKVKNLVNKAGKYIAKADDPAQFFKPKKDSLFSTDDAARTLSETVKEKIKSSGAALPRDASSWENMLKEILDRKPKNQAELMDHVNTELTHRTSLYKKATEAVEKTKAELDDLERNFQGVGGKVEDFSKNLDAKKVELQSRLDILKRTRDEMKSQKDNWETLHDGLDKTDNLTTPDLSAKMHDIHRGNLDAEIPNSGLFNMARRKLKRLPSEEDFLKWLKDNSRAESDKISGVGKIVRGSQIHPGMINRNSGKGNENQDTWMKDMVRGFLESISTLKTKSDPKMAGMRGGKKQSATSTPKNLMPIKRN